MKKIMQIGMVVSFMTTMAGYAGVLMSEDFETGQTVGEMPTGATIVRPSPSLVDTFTHVVDDSVNTAGTGNGVQIKDDGTDQGAMLTYNFVADATSQLSAVRVDFSFAALSSAGAGDDFIAVAFGEYSTSKTLNTSANRFTDMRLYNDGTVDFRSASGTSKYNVDISTGSHTVSIFVNDYDLNSIAYTGLDSQNYTLPTNSVAYWLDGALIHTTLLDLGDTTAGGTVGTSEDNLGKFGFNTGSSDVGLDYVIDDIEISDVIPEPAALGMVTLTSAVFIFIRRRLMI